MHPYIAQDLGQAHRTEMHRSAEAWRSTHPARTRARKSPRWWTSLRSRPHREVVTVPAVVVPVRSGLKLEPQS
jgi:hypothetical protein